MKLALQNSLHGRTGPQNYHDTNGEPINKIFEINLNQIATINTNMNRLMSAFIDHVNLNNFFYFG